MKFIPPEVPEMFHNQPVLYNQTRNILLAQRVVIADSLFTRLRGLMLRPSLPPGEALWLRPCNSIHTLFMRFPIDVVFLEENNRVIKIIHNLQPWQISPLVRGGSSVLELAAGTLKNRASPGDQFYIGPAPR